MALNKKITKPNGLEISYHKIGSITLHGLEDGTYALIVGVNSYITRDIRIESTDYFVDTGYYSLNATADAIESQPVLSVAYGLLKLTQEFSGATDV